jgi:hypothetical protein
VFARANPGFDAIVGNPPFAGKNTIASGHPLAYPDWLKTLHPGAHGNADLVAHFFRRAFGLLRKGGAMGLIATNTIRQGDTRDTGLRRIIADGGTIYRAVSRAAWEGEAAVVVAQVFICRGEAPSPPILDDRPVRRISAYLVEGDLDGSPARLRANSGKSFAGYEIYGMGFTFDDENVTRGKSSSLAEMRALISDNPKNSDVILPYLGGEEVNNLPTQTYHRYTIDFRNFPLSRTNDGNSWVSLTASDRLEMLRRGTVPSDYPYEVAADWPDLLEIVRKRVLPERQKQDRQRRTDFWWQFGEVAPNLRKSLDAIGNGRCIVTNRGASPHMAFAMVPANICLAKTLAVFALSTHAAFSTLQSRVHETWARFFASTLEDRLRYTPSDCFETFPLPPNHLIDPTLEAAGQTYHDTRAALMIARDQGMTPTYNRFHARTDEAADIVGLRDLHHAMDQAVLRAYGWDDLADRASPCFLNEDDEDDHQYCGRLFWPAAFRDEVLARLLKLNGERAMAETGL